MTRLIRNEPEFEISQSPSEYFGKFVVAVINGLGLGLGLYLIYKLGLVEK